jgi:N12 class adenine-specific DNA methylase
LKEVIRLQLQSANEGQLAECQEQLLQHYESYRANFGPLNNVSTAKVFEDDPEYPLLTALENVDPETSRISLADIFTKRTIRPYEPLRELPSDPKAAMLQVLAECGRLDTGLMSRLLDKPEADVIGQLVTADPRADLVGWMHKGDHEGFARVGCRLEAGPVRFSAKT